MKNFIEKNNISNTLDRIEEEIQLTKTVKLPSMEYCQDYWNTSQTKVVVPSRHINSIKKAPISPLIAISAMSAKENGYTVDGTGKGARIMNIRRLKKLHENLTEIRNTKNCTINSHIKKLLELRTKEFEFGTLETSKGKEELYFKLDYSDGFVLLDLRVMHYMLTNYKDNIIQAYIIFLWNCRNGWSQLTRVPMAEHLGLSRNSEKQSKTIMDTLVHDGFIEQRKKHEKIQIVDSKTGIPTTRVIPYYEYRVTIVDEIK